MNNCKQCGSVLLTYVDFNTNNTDNEICVNCNNIDPTQKEIVNASPLNFSTKEGSTIFLESIEKTFNAAFLKPIPQGLYRNYQPPKQYIDIVNTKLATSAKPNYEYKELIKIEPQNTKDTIHYDPKIKINIDWSKIIGYDQIKAIISKTLNSIHKKRVHVLLCGAPGTSKTVFLLTVLESLTKQKLNAHYLDATTLTSSGVIEYMFNNDMEFALIDELDKLEKKHQATFLNTLETGMLQETKNNKIRAKNMKNCTFIITANYKEKILQPLFTRMLPLMIPEYTKEEFYKIGVQLLHTQYNKTEEIALYIVDNVYKTFINRGEKPNLRFARDIAILTDNNKHDIDPILEGITTYSNVYIE